MILSFWLAERASGSDEIFLSEPSAVVVLKNDYYIYTCCLNIFFFTTGNLGLLVI